MTKRKTRNTVLVCAVILCLLAGTLYWMNRGAPAVQAATYEQPSALAPGKELTFLSVTGPGVPGMKPVAESVNLVLYYQEETTEVAVLDKRSGQIWYSNPVARAQDTKASPYEVEVLSSQLTVSFRDTQGTIDSYPNFAQSIGKQQFTAESIDNGVRVTYTLGDMSLGIDAMPKYISKERLTDKVLSKLDDTLAKYVSARYYPSKTKEGMLERLDDQVKKQLVLKKMLDAFAKAGYSEEDLAADNEAGGLAAGGPASDKPKFTLPLEYRLEGDSLTATVPVGQISESAAHRVRSIDLLAYFGAADSKEEGYMLVPDGTGSLIHLNNGKVKDEQYVQRVYGNDSNDNSRLRGMVSESARMPVFGLKAGDNAWFAVIDQGDAIASIVADISGKQNSYNHAYASFAVRGEDELELYTGSTIQEIQLLSNKLYTGDITVRYSFLSGDDADYSGMARFYQDELVQAGKLAPLTENSQLPFYLDILGAVDKQKSLLGVPYDAIVPMTTFAQAGEITDKLAADGVGRLQMRYLGWFGKGINHKTPVKVKTDGVVGSKQGLQELSAKLAAHGGNLYPDVAFQHIYHDDGNFTPSSDAARFVTKDKAELAPVDRNTHRMDNYFGSYQLLSPAKLPYFVEQFAKKYATYGQDSLSLRDLGGVLSSDYRDSRPIFRQTAKNIVTEQLSKLAAEYPRLMIADANAYAWGYADQLIDVPTGTSGFNIADEAVPFYQMVIHGFRNYTGAALNLEDEQDIHSQFLRALELGSAPHFLWSYESASELKYTRYSHIYSSSYKDWYDQAVALYKEANGVLAGLQHQRMIEHVRHQNGVVEMKYEGGASILINYGNEPVTVGGKLIPARDYVMGSDAS